MTAPTTDAEIEKALAAAREKFVCHIRSVLLHRFADLVAGGESAGDLTAAIGKPGRWMLDRLLGRVEMNIRDVSDLAYCMRCELRFAVARLQAPK